MTFGYIILFTPDRADWTVGLFYKYGHLMRAGRVPYRDFMMEYPSLSAPLFWLPGRFAHNLTQYRLLFAFEMLAFDLLGIAVAFWALGHFAPDALPWRVILAQPLWLVWAARILVFERFDLAPAVLMLLAIALCADGHKHAAWAALGLATALKLYPIVITPLFALVAWRRRTLRQVVSDIGTFGAAVAAPSLIVSRDHPLAVAAFLRYHADRGLEIETSYASVLMIGRLIGLGQPVSQRWGHGAYELVAPLAPLLLSLTLPLTCATLIVVYVVAWRNQAAWSDGGARFHGLVRLSTAAVLTFMLAGKVLSPQYLVWLYPLVAVLGDRQLLIWTLFGLALLLTNWVFPEHYYQLLTFQPREMEVLLLRNAVLLLLAALLLVPCPAMHRTGMSASSARASAPAAAAAQ